MLQEKFRLLMEETGCEQGEAELALELAGQDLEKAIRTIANLLRHISAVKGKLSFPSKNLYGLLLMVINTKTQEILRLHTVVSYNPALYENSPKMDWYSLEKLIFSYRLDEGSLPDFTQQIEQRLLPYMSEQKEILVKCELNRISELLSGFFAPEQIIAALEVEELNLTQFQQLPDGAAVSAPRGEEYDLETGVVRLQVEIIDDKNGKEARRLEEGDTVLSYIVDPRDIAHYLAHLIGSRKDGESVPMPAVVRKVINTDGESEVHLSYAPGIMGVTRVKNGVKVKIADEDRSQPWWKKIIPWG